jgi:hypothetical protein
LAEADILGPSDRRRIWSAQEKAALLAEIDAEGGKGKSVGRLRGFSAMSGGTTTAESQPAAVTYAPEAGVGGDRCRNRRSRPNAVLRDTAQTAGRIQFRAPNSCNGKTP